MSAPTAQAVDGLVRDLGAAFSDHGVEAYLVGGFVRDRLLGNPSKDIDIVCINNDGLAALRQLAEQRGWSPPVVFERFGTAQIRGDDFIVETVRARKEQYDPQSRKPEVAPGTLEEDVMRRDFTVNALCQRFDDEIIDLTQRGLADLEAKVLRTPLEPRETFREDPLRMFRAARFVAQLGFQLADGVLDAMAAEASRAGVLSVERIRDELVRLLVSPHARDGMNTLREANLLDFVASELKPMQGVEQGGYHIYDVWEHTLHALNAAPPDLITRLAALFHDIGKPPTHEIVDPEKHTFYGHPQVGAEIAKEAMTRLRFSNDETAQVAKLVELHLRPIQYDANEWTDSAVRRLIRDAGDLRARLIDLAKADTVASSYPSTDELDQLGERMNALDQGAAVSQMQSPLSGAEIMELAALPAGRWVGAVKAALENAVIEGEISPGDREAAKAWLQARPELWNNPSL